MTVDGQTEPAHGNALRVLPIELAVCQLAADAALPAWATSGAFYSVTRTGDELSIVCDFDVAPAAVKRQGPWACLEFEGPLDFSLTGILAGVAVPLANVGISIFAISTYRTDYVLVPAGELATAATELRRHGYSIG